MSIQRPERNIIDIDSWNQLRVSEWSALGDDVWYLADKPAPGQSSRYGRFKWNIKIDAHRSLCDPEFRRCLEHVKLWLWTMIHDPRESKPISPGGMGSIHATVETGVRWMVHEGMKGFGEFDNEASWRFLDWFVSEHEKTRLGKLTRSPKLTRGSANRRLSFVALVYRQRMALQRFGVRVPAEPPFDGRRVDEVVRHDLDLHEHGRLVPIPDDVALLLMRESQRLLEAPADDVMSLVRQCRLDDQMLLMGQTSVGNLEAYHHDLRVIREFAFAKLEGENNPWTNIGDPYARTLLCGRQVTIDERQALRRLIITIQAAAVICIQACTGMRASELAALEDDGSGDDLPSCVISRLSQDKLLELFYCRGVELKVNKVRTEWLIGARLAGTEDMPPPVRAFSILHKLFHPWRNLAKLDRLLIVFSAAKGLPRQPSSISAATSGYLTNLQKDFLREQCDTSGLSARSQKRFLQSNGLRGHLWRSTFAIYLYRIDPRLIAPISRHFKHLRVAMTETKYIGNDVELIAAADESRVTESARFFHEAIHDHQPVVGSLAKYFDELVMEEQATLDDCKLAVTDQDLRLLDFDYGVCGVSIKPEQSLCNRIGGTASWAKTSPNEAFRGVSMCVGCPCFAASRRHLPYWEKRLRSLEQAVEKDQKSQDKGSYVLEQRMHSARTIVERLREPLRGNGVETNRYEHS